MKEQNPLPQSGWYLDTDWAAALNIEVRQFRRNLREHQIPHGKFGNAVIVKAEDFYASLPDGGDK
ncbi:hypothetical protein GYB59_14460 [bacterium]|uniref:DNA-binding protein n=1 Tax=Rubinisphaera brasiliensis (strain ATCC 49424 / DSM 5305 / JCM 21570 / IAM 15109 / NBRC 103401 / IFAM 1448) TaxID=756272 RepID=F0SL33_RUBBR|nr:hypothetical protein [Rubinisphaera brasiliensis]ADY60916.1 hypothetical protein Plabr_3319 [Rubinisphaera brasiliensis DSM 5305]MBR9802807.1 hypothetical protein [bacterium]